MSKARLTELKTLIEKEGWKVLDENFPNDPDRFKVVDGSIDWLLTHECTETRVKLTFPVYTLLGENSTDLNDIISGLVPGTSIRIIFEKKGSEKWKINIIRFLDEINALKNKP